MARYKQISRLRRSNFMICSPSQTTQVITAHFAAIERDNEIKSALNEAGFLPASEALVIELGDGQKCLHCARRSTDS